MKQNYLPGFDGLGVKKFGGCLNDNGKVVKGNPREARPISLKKPLHLVMRSSLARGERSFLSIYRYKRIEKVVRSLAKKKGIQIYRYSNAGNHLHIVLQTRSRDAFNAFIKAISGIIARITLNVEKGKAKNLKFWDARPFTRILEWGKDFRTVMSYTYQNTLEALGFIPLKIRKTAYG